MKRERMEMKRTGGHGQDEDCGMMQERMRTLLVHCREENEESGDGENGIDGNAL